MRKKRAATKRETVTGQLQFYPQYMLAARGINKPMAWAVKLGFYNTLAGDIVHGRCASLKWGQVETLCTALNCTPNDLFKFEHKHKNLPEGHELLKLQREETVMDIQEELKNLSTEKLEELRKFLKEG